MNSQADGFIRLQLALPFVQRVRDMGKDPAPVLKALALEEKMMNDPRMGEIMSEGMPFDGKRLIMGGFDSILEVK